MSVFHLLNTISFNSKNDPFILAIVAKLAYKLEAVGQEIKRYSYDSWIAKPQHKYFGTSSKLVFTTKSLVESLFFHNLQKKKDTSKGILFPYIL